MNDLFEQKKLANQLRKSGDIEAALPIYEKLWDSSKDEFDGAGLLHCLRKTDQYDRAIPLAEELLEKFPSFNWIRNEAIWTFISGKLNPLNDESFSEILKVSKEIMELHPDIIARKKIAFKVLKSAKKRKKWEVMTQWIQVIDLDALNPDPLIIQGKEGWSEQALWYYYNSISLIHQNKYTEVISQIDTILDKFPKQKKFFLRCKAHAHIKLEEFLKAKECYESLIQYTKTEWWIYHEYGSLIAQYNLETSKDIALEWLYLAAIRCPNYNMGISLYRDIGLLLKQKGELETSRDHFLLVKKIREKNEWQINEELNNTIDELDKLLENFERPNSISVAFKKCKIVWESSGERKILVSQGHRRKIRPDIKGKVIFGYLERPFCFITTPDGESYFCLKGDLTEGIQNEEDVLFDGYPSFDKKKQKESWKARNVRKI
ncbi:tetratricopeptide (TPR) repeat protein [Methanolinea mesophila]|uniref:tetratricopeptide repeat protein n=1 Tax=Methanolinea mesophila TaxID=547055 RepID=UPI001AE68DB9|nr:tetratricopeptide repeat protein [Methanolinea mesophila]MBP1928940.1 tetratricopeptide (TPR) repeat protein [Methanolinea mesophila]